MLPDTHTLTHIKLASHSLQCLEAVLTSIRWDCLHAHCNSVGVTSPLPVYQSASGFVVCSTLLKFSYNESDYAAVLNTNNMGIFLTFIQCHQEFFPKE